MSRRLVCGARHGLNMITGAAQRPKSRSGQERSQMHNSFLFLMIATCIMMCINFIMTCFAVSDDKDYADFLVVVEIILILTFLVSGFLGFEGI